jgi:cholesterol transport system auxiliary component
MPYSLKQPLSYKMAYAYSKNERGYYQNSQWSNNLGKMLQGYLIQTLQQSRLYKAVLPYESAVPEDQRLESIVYDFSHHVNGGLSHAVVSIEFALVDMHSGKLIKRRRFSYQEPTPTVDAKGYVTATNKVLEKLSWDLREWLKRR